jgi:hypothetical protein
VPAIRRFFSFRARTPVLEPGEKHQSGPEDSNGRSLLPSMPGFLVFSSRRTHPTGPEDSNRPPTSPVDARFWIFEPKNPGPRTRSAAHFPRAAGFRPATGQIGQARRCRREPSVRC